MTPRVRPLRVGIGTVCAVTAGCVTAEDLIPSGAWTRTGRKRVNSLTGAEGKGARPPGPRPRTSGPASPPAVEQTRRTFEAAAAKMASRLQDGVRDRAVAHGPRPQPAPATDLLRLTRACDFQRCLAQ